MSKYKLNRKGLGMFMKSEPIKLEMGRRANLIKARAVAIAPVGRNDETRGHAKVKVERYKDAFKVTTGVRRAGTTDVDLGQTFKSSRAYARVENTKPYAVFVEYGVSREVRDKDGTVRRERINAHRVFGRAIAAARD